MDSSEIHCAQHGLLLVPVHITRFINNRVMCMTNPLFSAQTYEAATVQLLLSESLENQNNGFSMAERQRRWSCWSVPTLFQDYSAECCSGRKACKYAQIYKLDSSENHMLIIHFVHFIFFICDSWKNVHLLHVVRKTFILQYVGYTLRRTQSHNRVLLHRTLLYEQKMKQG